jgi:hypothetical protein
MANFEQKDEGWNVMNYTLIQHAQADDPLSVH